MTLLPGRFVQPQKTVLYVGAEILEMLSDGPMDLGGIGRSLNINADRFVSYEDAALTVSMLFALGLVIDDGDRVLRVELRKRESVNDRV